MLRCLTDLGITQAAIRDGYSPDTAQQTGNENLLLRPLWIIPLLSKAIEQGLCHPRCKDSHSTYFPELYEDEQPYTREEIAQLEQGEHREQKQQNARRQAERYRRLERHSLDPENRQRYGARAEEWERELYRHKGYTHQKVGASGEKIIPQALYHKLIEPVERAGGTILRGTKEAEEHLIKVGASASHIGGCILLRRDATISDVLEETYHFQQMQRGMFQDRPYEIQNVLMEIDAKQYLLSVSKEYKIPVEECELTQRQLEEYQRIYEEWRAANEGNRVFHH